MNRKRGFTLIELMIVLAVLGVAFGIAAYGCSMNYGGRNHAHAVKEAKHYVASLVDAGVDAKFVSCVEFDTDNPPDNYLACTITVDNVPQTIDCAGDAIVMENHGCKAYVPKLRVTNTYIDTSSTITRPTSTTGSVRR